MVAIDTAGGGKPGYGGMLTPPRDPGRGVAGLFSTLGWLPVLVNRVLKDDARRIARLVDRQRGL